jgi:S-adenosylmethionine decarboxylase
VKPAKNQAKAWRGALNQPTGVHCILELFDCPFELLNNETFICRMIDLAAAESGSTLLSMTSHHFDPQGVTALGLLAESHISIHTWPENGYAAADIFTCGSHCDPQKASEFLIEKLKAHRHTLSVIERGSFVSAKIATFRQINGQDNQCIRTNLNPPYG